MGSKGWDHTKDIPDLTGKIALVTGGSRGIGIPTVALLAKAGAKVYLTARTEASAQAAIEGIYSEHKGIAQGLIVPLPLELEDLASVFAASALVLQAEKKLDILINNAAIGNGPSRVVSSGADVMMAVNHIGHFALFRELKPLLVAAASEEGADVRVITLSSHAMLTALPLDYRPDFTDPAGGDFANPGAIALDRPAGFWDTLRRYAVTKVATTLFAAELQARCDAEDLPILSVSLHPGTIRTPGSLGVVPGFLHPLFSLIAGTPLTGAKNTLFLATAPRVRDQDYYYKGQYVKEDGSVVAAHPAARSSALGRELWTATESLVGGFKARHGL